jgi:DNA-directed RNA polymerase delta subunit
MVTKKESSELNKAKLEIKELAMQLADMFRAALYFAGVKKDKMQDATSAYIEAIDEIFEDEEGEMGFEEIIKVIEHLKKSRPSLFL